MQLSGGFGKRPLVQTLAEECLWANRAAVAHLLIVHSCGYVVSAEPRRHQSGQVTWRTRGRHAVANATSCEHIHRAGRRASEGCHV